jgi:hypothetical protein
MGLPLPDFIANAPELQAGLEIYLKAFYDLDSERSYISGVAAIPWSKIKDYAEFYQFSEEQTEDLFYLIRAMDNAHMNRVRAENAKNSS